MGSIWGGDIGAWNYTGPHRLPVDERKTLVTRGGGQAVRIIHDSLLRLRSILEPIRSRVLYGPVPGALVPFQMNIAGAITAAGVAYVPIYTTEQFEAKPMMFSAYCPTAAATVTVDPKYDDGSGFVSILTAPLVVTGGSVNGVNTSALFAVNKILRPSNRPFLLRLDVTAITGAPVGLWTVLAFVGVADVGRVA